MSLAINKVPDARVVFRPGRGEHRAAESLGGGDAIGPLGLLDFELVAAGEAPSAGVVRTAPPSVEALMLWDAEPAGDRLRLRLNYKSSAPIGLAAIKLEPGLIVRSALVPGLIDAVREGDTWIARVEPAASPEIPLSIALDLWRSNPTEAAGSALRRLPAVVPEGVAEFKGAIGFRRPAAWSGSMRALEGTEPMTEDAFAAAWGDLGENPPLSGVTRFYRAPSLAIAAGPNRSEGTCLSNVSLVVGAGRIDASAVSFLENQTGGTFEAVINVGKSFHVINISANGLVNWSRLDPERVIVRFDGAALSKREIRTKGWLPIETDPMARGAARVSSRVFWPFFENALEQPGTLAIDSPGPFEIDPPQVDVGESERSGDRRKALYRIDRPVELKEIRRRVNPGVKVSVLASLAVLKDSAWYLARVKYESEGGAPDALYLRFPREWAERARLDLAGGKVESASGASKGFTDWTITPAADSWSVQELTIRAVMPRAAGSSIAFPSLVPLGKGSAQSLILAQNASGGPIAFEASRGLKSLDIATYGQRGGAGLFSDRVPTRCYEVTADAWSLSLTETPIAAGESGRAHGFESRRRRCSPRNQRRVRMRL